MKSKTKMITAITLIVLTCRFKYALAPSCTAAEISRIRSFPDGARMTAAIKTKANARPITAHTIDSGTPKLRMFKARKFIFAFALKRTTL
jgi:hypothetical protein